METNNSFEVLAINKSNKDKYVIVDIKYPSSPKVYHYSRRVYYNTVLIDGNRIYFDSNMKVTKIKKEYETEGKKKKVKSNGWESKSTSEKIQQEISDKEIETEEPKEEVKEDPNNYDGVIRHATYDTIKTCLECNIPVYIAGPAGAGKNFTVEQIAEDLGWDFYFSNSIQQEYKLTGFVDAGGNYHETEFYKACTSENDCIFFLDELDASDESVAVLLNAAIANGYFEFPTGRVDLTNVHFVAAGNTVGSGADDLCTGRTVLDQSTLDRFAIIEFDYDRRVELNITKGNTELVNFVHSLRSQAKTKGIRATFSLRCLTMVTRLEKTSMALDSILKIAVVKGLDQDTINTFDVFGVDNKYFNALRKIQSAV